MTKLETLCELIVPGSSRTGAAVYVNALIASMPPEVAGFAQAAIEELDPDTLADQQRTPAFGFVRALVCEAYYSDFVAPGAEGPGAWSEIDFSTPLATRLNKDWSWLGIA